MKGTEMKRHTLLWGWSGRGVKGESL